MKKSFLAGLALAGLFAFFSCSKPSGQLLLAGSGWSKIVLIDKASKAIQWEYPLEDGWECNAVGATADGNILFSYGKGAKLVTRDKQDVWNIPAPDSCEMQTARVLPDGNFLLAWCGHPATILEVDKNGAIISRTEFDTGIGNPHAQFRQIVKNPRGNYMVPLFASSEVREITPSGETLQNVKVDGTPFSTAILPNGNWLVAGGDGHCVIELAFETGETVRTIQKDGIAGAPLAFVAELLPTSTGGMYICNWQGHRGAKAPQVFEIDKDGKMVWSIEDTTTFGMISAISQVK